MKIDFDVDMDFKDRDHALKNIDHIIGSIKKEDKTIKHNTGIYLQNIPSDYNNISTIDHKEAEGLGYFKIDFLNAGVYSMVKDRDHLKRLANQEPEWDLLLHQEFVEGLFHIKDYHELLKEHKPKNIEQLAMVLAIIRPGKKHLQGKSWKEIENEVWIRPDDDTYFFKKSHSISYAMAIVVQMNAIVERASHFSD